MRIRSFGVYNVLHYDSAVFDFGPAPALHILYGPNEAGKSTLLQLLLDLLFGGKLSEDRRDHYNSASRIEGTLENGRGSQLFIERKRRYHQLVLTGSPHADAVERELHRWMGGYDRDRFSLLFGFDHDGLRRGGESLLQSGGHAGVSLFEAGGGVQFLQNVLSTLSARAGELVDPSFHKRSAAQLNKAWRAYQEATQEVRTHSLRGEEWHKLRGQIASLEREIAGLEQSLARLERDKARLERIRRVRSLLAELDDAEGRLRSLGAVLVLPTEEDERVLSLLERHDELRECLARQRAELQRKREAALAVPRDPQVLAHADEIVALNERLQQYVARKTEELPKAEERLRQQQHSVAQLLHSLRPDLTVADAHGLWIPFSVRQEVEQLANAIAQALSQVEAEQKRYEEYMLDGARCERALSELGNVPDVSALRRLVAQVRSHGDLEEQIAKCAREVEARRGDLLQLLQAQALWTGSPEDLAAAPVPLRETVDRYAQEWKAHSEALAACERERQRLNEERAQALRDLERLELGGRVPVEAELAAVRQRRDEGWRLIRQVLAGTPDETAILAYAGGLSLEEAYETAVRQADDMVDWMRREAKRSVERAMLLLRAEQAAHAMERLSAEHEALAAEFAACAARWQQEWAATGIDPKPPEEMRAWLSAFYQPVVNGVRECQELRRQQAQLCALRDRAMAELSSACAQVVSQWSAREAAATAVQESAQDPDGALQQPELDWHGGSPASTASLSILLSRCDDILRMVDELASKHQRYRDQLDEIRSKAEPLAHTLRRLRSDLEEKMARWRALRSQYPTLPEAPDIAARYVQQLQQLQDRQREAQRLTEDIAAMRAACGEFEARVLTLTQVLGEPAVAGGSDGRLVGSPTVEGIVRRARQRLERAQAAEERYRQMADEVARMEEQLARLEEEWAECTGQVHLALSQYGCADLEALRAMAEQSALYKQIDAERKEKERTVCHAGDQLPLADIRAEVAAFMESSHYDELPAQLAALTERMADLKQQLQMQREQLQELRITFRQWDGSHARAAEKAQEAEHHLAAVDRYWHEYVRVELARRLLQRAIEAFREQNESTIVRRASEFFCQLTCGRYQGLAVEHDDAAPYLEAIAAGGTRRRVQQLSDGTRDQLFLALRLAFVDQHMRDGDPLPIIMDDILIHFDDERTEATLRVLRELAQRTQVLYFTHHRAIVEAVQTLDAQGVRVHDLAGLRQTV